MSPHHVLVVDDNIDNLFLLQTILEAEGFLVDSATDGQMALQKMANTPPDLLLLDIMMPGLNGYDVTQAMRHDHKLMSIPIVLVSAHSDADIDRGLALGANAFLGKPIDCAQLLTTIGSLLS